MSETLSRYTDMLYVEQPPQQHRNEVGDLIDSGTATMERLGACREKPNGSGSVLQSASGVTIAYQSEIYLHASVPAVPINSLIKVFNADGMEVLHGKVLRYKKYKHYAKIWV